MNYLDDTGDEVMLHGGYKNTTIVGFVSNVWWYKMRYDAKLYGIIFLTSFNRC